MKRLAEHGGPLIEFIIILPLMCIIVAFFVNIASFVWEMITLSDAARFGVRAGMLACYAGDSDYKTVAGQEATSYRSNKHLRWGGFSVNGDPNENYAPGLFIPEVTIGANTIPAHGVPARILEVRAEIGESLEKCYFCVGGLLMTLNPESAIIRQRGLLANLCS